MRTQLPLEFCVHNAQLPHFARFYLRYPDQDPKTARARFVPWFDKGEAKQMADDLNERCAEDKGGDRVFLSTRGLPEGTKTKITSKVQELFDKSLWPEVAKLCYPLAERSASNE
jgi:hypothetical protein